MDNTRFPIVSKELIEELERRFPDKMPDGPSTFQDYLVKQGQVLVVRFLRHQFTLQNQNILEN